jgi:hypothetical protein
MASEVKAADLESVSWEGADGQCYTYGKAPKRQCAKCPETFDWDGSKYKSLCKRCYVLNVRKCVKCKTANLKINAPLYQTMCTDCFIEKKHKTHVPCPRCPPERRNHLRCPIGKECCPECETRGVSALPQVLPAPLEKESE